MILVGLPTVAAVGGWLLAGRARELAMARMRAEADHLAADGCWPRARCRSPSCSEPA